MPTKAKITIKTKIPAKWQKVFTPQIIIATTICIFCVIMTIVCLLNPGTKEVSVTSPIEDLAPLNAITPKNRVVQKFTSDNDYIRFGLYYANFTNYIQCGTLYVSVENSQKEVTELTYSIGSIFDNGFLYIDYPLKKDETYIVTIRVSEDAEGITFFTTTAENYDAMLTINGHTEDSSIVMVFNNNIKDAFTAWYYVMTIALVACYIVLKVDRSVYDKKN